MMQLDAPIFVAGHRGMVGSAIARNLQSLGYTNLVLCGRDEVDLLDQRAVQDFFKRCRPEYVFMAAARVGGIGANSLFPVEFMIENLRIELNVLQSAYENGVKKLLFLGSSCIYPKLAEQPMHESSLLTGPLELSNEAYALAKICGVRLCQYYKRQYNTNFISVMPTNLYGPGDNYDLESAHVVPALIRRFHEAKENRASNVTLWGTGKPLRELLHVDDLASACLLLMDHYNESEQINAGAGEEISILDLATLIKGIVGFEGDLVWDSTRPDGTPRKLLDSKRLVAMGWSPKIDLRSGIRSALEEWLKTKGD